VSPTLAKRLHLRDRNHQHTSSDTANLCISLGRVTAVAGSRHLPVAGALVGVCKAACAVDDERVVVVCVRRLGQQLPLQALCDDWSLSTCHSSQLAVRNSFRISGFFFILPAVLLSFQFNCFVKAGVLP
jgi:hypothetical protein